MSSIRRILLLILTGIFGVVAFLFFRKFFVHKSRQTVLFESVSPDSSGVDFNNKITTSDSLNIFTFEYIYNGGGVGVGDFNNDGKPDLFFVGNMVPSKLFLNKGNFHFKDITSSSGINTAGAWSFGVSVIDINQDGLQDIYVCAGGPGRIDTMYHNKLFINQGPDKNGDPWFKEMSAEYGLRDGGQSIQAAFFDYDHDGDLDMYLVKGGGFERSPIVPNPILKDGTAKNTDRLYQNEWNAVLGHPVFTDVSKKAGIVEEGFGLGISLLDINQDGWLDIYVTNDYITNDLLYVNNGNGTFSEKSKDYFKHTSYFAMGNDVGDINNDGLMDLMSVDMLPSPHFERMLMFGPNQYDKFHYAINNGYTYQYMRNTLQLNQGNGKFSEIGQLAGVYKTNWSWAILFADLDNDQYQDIFITNGFGKDITDLDFVKFRANYISQPKEERNKRVLFDSLKKRPATIIPNVAFQNNRDLSFTDVSAKWGFEEPTISNGAAYVDLDNDGDLDLVTNNIDGLAHIYRNNLREEDSTGSKNYLDIKFDGPKGNRSAIGARVEIHYDGRQQVRLQSTVRGFESTVQDIMHFGMAGYKKVDSLLITWPNGEQSLQTNVTTNQTLTVFSANSQMQKPFAKSTPQQNAFFTKISPANLNIKYCQKESKFNDFLYEKLLPKKYSMNGPGIAAGDINGDGLDDFFVGGSFSQQGELYIQNKKGSFEKRELNAEDAGSIDMGAVFFDADGDGDLDLFVASGSSDYTRNYPRYQPRLYINDGRGNFKKDISALPKLLTSSSCVIAADYDGDGDMDLFIGGRVEPGFFPEIPSSTILRNDHGKFTDVTDIVAPGLGKIGMVTSALWTDIDNDNKPDLIITGEWMPLTIFKNTGGHFVNITKEAGLSDTEGWWQSIVAGDFDNDGDMDYVLGNWGLNSPYTASVENPMTVSYKDFDKDGHIDAILSYYEGGINYPSHSWESMIMQMPSLRKKLAYYHDYAATTTDQLLGYLDTNGIKTAYCKNLSTIYMENLGSGKFKLHEMPRKLQFSPVYGMKAEDLNNDGKLDLVSVGNFYGTEVVVGRYDASIGLAMIGNGQGGFSPVESTTSGFCADGDSKAICRIESVNKHSLLIVTQNSDSLKVFQETYNNGLKRIPIEKMEMSAVVHLNNGQKRKVEFSYGDTYLSQSSRSFIVTSGMTGIDIFDGRGKLTRTLAFR